MMNKVQTWLLVAVGVLTIACIGLSVAVANSSSDPETSTSVSEAAELVQTSSARVEVDKNGAEWETDPRLPKHLIPLHYDLWLHPDLKTGLFTGRVRIDVDARQSTEYFLAHVKQLNISKTRLTRLGEEDDIPLKTAFEYKENEYWVVIPESPVDGGNYSLYIEFDGSLTEGITGFYKSVYKNDKGEEVAIATSKFQPTDARKAFPCFDEPSFKSSFTVTLVRPSDGYIALSNMPVDQETQNSPAPETVIKPLILKTRSDAPHTYSLGLTEVKFQKSVPMVTYLACFIVCDFEFEEKLTSIHETKFRVYATPQQRSRVQYSLDIGANITDYFTDYFNISYPLPKQDMIAIPDFVSGAMEHWGLITYRETNLLYDSESSSSNNQQRVATVVSHELVHQWFGNLVTLDWWDDLWLNEGFASYMEYKGVKNYHPDWDMEAQFLTADLHNVLDLDSTVNSHPIVQEVSHPNQITELFDRISYSKGASVLRMLENFMGDEPFRQGIHLFLDKYKYKNAVTRDLWRSLEQVTDLNIEQIMDTWTRQMGFPVLHLDKLSDTKYRVTQQRFLIDSSAKVDEEESPFSYMWEVPVTWITSNNNSTQLQWLSKCDKSMDVEVEAGTEWVKFNVGQFGYYRVNYPSEQWTQLANLLVQQPQALGPMDRASLLNDAFALAEAGHLNYTTPLDMIAYLAQETHLVPWDTVYSSLNKLGVRLRNSLSFREYRQYIVHLVKDHYHRLGWEDEGSHTDKLNRYNILNLACGYGYKPCLEEAKNIFAQWIEDQEYYIKPNLRALVYKYGVQGLNDPDAWEEMFSRYVDEINSQEKAKLLYGLVSIKEPWILQRFIILAKNESNIRSQDYLTALSYLSSNPIGNMLVWNFVQSEWQYLLDRFGVNNRYLGRIPKTVAGDFSTQFQLKQVKDLFAAYPNAGAGTRARKQALEEIENNIKWQEQHLNDIEQWLKQK